MNLHKTRKKRFSPMIAMTIAVILMTGAVGCKPMDLLAPISTINLVIPLGLAGNTGIFNPPAGQSTLGISLADELTGTTSTTSALIGSPGSVSP